VLVNQAWIQWMTGWAVRILLLLFTSGTDAASIDPNFAQPNTFVDPAEEARARAHTVFLRLALPPYTIHFKSPTYLQPSTLDLLDKRVCKETLKLTAQDVWVRLGIGRDAKYWHEFVLLLKAAIPSLERRSFQHWDPSSVDYDSTSGALIAGNYPGLWRDLERLNDIISISRNVLTIGTEAQEWAVKYCADLEIFRLINCCVRVTARGYDGNAGTGEEEKWQLVVNAYKKLLITCLQVLNNLVAQNEKRKSMLWTSLFDHASESGFLEEEVTPREVPPPKKPTPPICSSDILLAYGQNGSSRISPFEYEAAQPLYSEEGFLPLPANAIAAKKHAEPNGYVYFTARFRKHCEEEFHAIRGRQPTLAEIHRNIPHYWHEEMRSKKRVWAEWQENFERALGIYRDQEADYQDYSRDRQGWRERVMEGRPPLPPKRQGKSWQPKDVEQRIKELEQQVAEEVKHECAGHGYCENPAECEKRSEANGVSNSLDPRTSSDQNDLQMLFTAEAGTKILESGKAELMKRLEGYPHDDAPGGPTERRGSSARSAPLPAVSRHNVQHNAETNGSGIHRRRSSSYTVEDAFAEESLDEEEEGEEESEEDGEEEEEEEDYPGSTEDGRGLLTDVPLILGPSEIEVLPMLVMSGLVVPPAEEHPTRRNNYKSVDPTEGNRWDMPRDAELNAGARLRTHLLLSQTPGRNLLRELLIFVAAWDLREEELYFKFMLRILEAILRHGLMPYAYHAFRDRSRSKDIISPAQAVIMKLLTCIFRQRNENIRKHLRGEHLEGEMLSYHYMTKVQGRKLAALLVADDYKRRHLRAVKQKQSLGLLPSAVDLRLLNFVFTEFRQHIIPQTCALIFLQGQIHRGRASPDDFPLNLWDMERMYEGVYQFLEFFAVLSEEQGKVSVADDGIARVFEGKVIWGQNEMDEAMGGVKSWKGILASWEMASELVTLLRELEGGIPKVGAVLPDGKKIASAPHAAASFSNATSTAPPPPPPMQRSLSADAAVAGSRTDYHPVAVERPFDVDPIPASLTPGAQPTQRVYEAETPLAYPDDALAGLPTSHHAAHVAHLDTPHDQDEPSDFEWRNLKKLTVLVLSSLIWKNKEVQDQVRRYGGLEALVGCCRPDENNPYIRDHAIMCLRFAVEGNEENAQALVRLAGHKGQLATAKALSGAGGEEGVKKLLLDNVAGLEGIPGEVLNVDSHEASVDGKRKYVYSTTEVASVLPSVTTSPASRPSQNALPQPATTKTLREWAAKSPFNLEEFLPSLTATAAAAASSSASGQGKAMPMKFDAKGGYDMLRNALLNTPLKDVGAQVEERHRIEALERLDRAFESAEAAVGRAKEMGDGKK
jgi:palmitoyltransferase